MNPSLPFYPRLLLVGGAGRNLGKTELVCRIVSTLFFPSDPPAPASGPEGDFFARDSFEKPIAVKIKTLRAGEEAFHGKSMEGDDRMEDVRIREETDPDGKEDGSRMLRAGARAAFRIRTPETKLDEALDRLMQILNERGWTDPWIVCESNGLRGILKPGLFLLVGPAEDHPWKESALRYRHLADLVILSNGRDTYRPDPVHSIFRDRSGWILRETRE